jgi:hypothetical protein
MKKAVLNALYHKRQWAKNFVGNFVKFRGAFVGDTACGRTDGNIQDNRIVGSTLDI